MQEKRNEKFNPPLSISQVVYNLYVDWFRYLMPESEPAEFDVYERVNRRG